jgi:hypothetical protein
MVPVATALIRSTATFCEFLEDRGFSVPAARDVRRQLKQAVLAAEPTRRVLLVERAGWHGSQFLLGSETLGRGTEELMVLRSPTSHAALAQRAGTLVDWKVSVANACEASSPLVLALCLAFAAPLARFAEIDGCCMHFWGRSTDLASLIPLATATVFGPGEGEAGNLRSWTQAAATIGHCDLPRILTDVGRLENAVQSNDLSGPALMRIFDAHRRMIELRTAQKLNAGLADANGSVLVGAVDI